MATYNIQQIEIKELGKMSFEQARQELDQIRKAMDETEQGDILVQVDSWKGKQPQVKIFTEHV